MMPLSARERTRTWRICRSATAPSEYGYECDTAAGSDRVWVAQFHRHLEVLRALPSPSLPPPPQVEFQHRTMDILVDSIKVDAEGDFLEEGEGSQYRFSVPQTASVAAAGTAKECRLVVQPALEKMSKTLRTTLLVDDAPVAPCSDSSAVPSSGPLSPAASGGGSSKSAAGAGAALIRSDSSAASAGKAPEPVPDAKGVLRFQVGKGFTSGGDASTV